MSKLKYLTPEQKNYYEDNGFIKISGLFTDQEFKEISDEYDYIFAEKSKENMEGLETAWTGDDMKRAANNINYTVKSIHNWHMFSDVFTRLITNPKLLDAVEDIMGANILLHHNKAHVKPPEKGAPYLMHQDYPYFPFKKHSMLAVFIHMDDTTPENGGLCVYPGSHKLGPLKSLELADTDGTADVVRYVDPQRFPISGATPISAKKGDIVIFSYLLVHGSYLNLSDRQRHMFLLQLRSADDEPLKDMHHSFCQDLVLRGRNMRRKANKATPFVDTLSNN